MHFTCNWIVLGVFNTSRNKISRSTVEIIKSIQETSWRSARSLKLDSYHVSSFRSCLIPVCSTPARQLLDTFYLSRFMNFIILIWFSWNSWLYVWAFFSPNPKHIKWFFLGPSKCSQVPQALSKLCSNKLWQETKFLPKFISFFWRSCCVFAP